MSDAVLDYHFRCAEGHTFSLSMTARQFIDGEHTCGCGKPAKRYVPTAGPVEMTGRARFERYRMEQNIESVKLPFHQPGADSYGPNGEQRFTSRRRYIEAGRRNGMVWA